MRFVICRPGTLAGIGHANETLIHCLPLDGALRLAASDNVPAFETSKALLTFAHSYWQTKRTTVAPFFWHFVGVGRIIEGRRSLFGWPLPIQLLSYVTNESAA